MEHDVERVWREFWTPLLVKNAEVDLEAIKRELYDFRVTMQEVEKVYMEITNGKFSKPNTRAEVILEEYWARVEEAEGRYEHW